MAHIHFYARSRSNWTPASYTTIETANIFNVAAGDLIGGAFCRVRTAFNGTNSDAAASLGDGDDVDRFMTTANMAIPTAGLKRGTGAGLTEVPGYLYTAADTIDITFTDDTGNDGTAGSLDVWVWVTRANPQ